MQSRKTLLQNKLFQKSCTCFLCYRTSVHCGVWSGVECSVECEDNDDSRVLSRECNVQGMKWGLWSVKCRV